jgi:hypothetical protein
MQQSRLYRVEMGSPTVSERFPHSWRTIGEPYQGYQVFHLALQSRTGRSITCVVLPSPTDTNPSVTPAGIRCSRFLILVRLVGIQVADCLNMRARQAMSYVS